MSDNKIVLKSVFKFPKVTIQPYKDSRGRFRCDGDWVRKVDANNDLILSEADKKRPTDLFVKETDTFVLRDGVEFDLNNDSDLVTWNWVKYSDRIAGSREEKELIDGKIATNYADYNKSRYGHAEFYIYIPGQEAQEKVKREEKVHDAKTFVFKDTEEGVYDRVRLLGHRMESVPYIEVKEFLLDLCAKSPERVIQTYTGSDTKLRLLLLKSIDRGLIIHKHNVYNYGTEIIGNTEDGAMMWLKSSENKDFVDQLKKDLAPRRK